MCGERRPTTGAAAALPLLLALLILHPELHGAEAQSAQPWCTSGRTPVSTTGFRPDEPDAPCLRGQTDLSVPCYAPFTWWQAERVLDEHNKLRKEHGACPLEYDASLADATIASPAFQGVCVARNASAAGVADPMNSTMTMSGTNVYTDMETSGARPMTWRVDGVAATQAWYCDEESLVDYAAVAAGGADVLDDVEAFAQVVWVAAARIGCAACVNGDFYAAMCIYDARFSVNYTADNIRMPGNFSNNTGCDRTPEPTGVPPTAVPATVAPGSPFGTTGEPNTAAPRTLTPNTAEPSTGNPAQPGSTGVPNSAAPPTGTPNTAEPSTASPSAGPNATGIPSTAAPSTQIPNTAAPTTAIPGAAPGTTGIPGTAAPPTMPPATALPSTADPAAPPGTTGVPNTAVPPSAQKNRDGDDGGGLSAIWVIVIIICVVACVFLIYRQKTANATRAVPAATFLAFVEDDEEVRMQGVGGAGAEGEYTSSPSPYRPDPLVVGTNAAGAIQPSVGSYATPSPAGAVGGLHQSSPSPTTSPPAITQGALPQKMEAALHGGNDPLGL